MSDLDKINSIFNAKIDSVKTKEDLQKLEATRLVKKDEELILINKELRAKEKELKLREEEQNRKDIDLKVREEDQKNKELRDQRRKYKASRKASKIY